MEVDHFDDLDDDEPQEWRRLEPYLELRPRWGNWYRTKSAGSTAALFNVEHGYSEFEIGDLDTVHQLLDRLAHFLDKPWCSGPEVRDLRFALRAVLGVRLQFHYRRVDDVRDEVEIVAMPAEDGAARPLHRDAANRIDDSFGERAFVSRLVPLS